ncbi:hypothetical protein AWB91_09475 [Mycobacterium paraense]|uniref:Uncharacterized protein n=1 Tax=Mycobacterium paraense TaxID=767916 RepID=A0ABX3VR03_9MYCO|nr:hypothetical protein [Mycobacterium paraense]ORW32714.1 hypothetical protein AWB91_09475 [Mycobacterium paraense]ORW44939.1 hypothetical protein AWB88_04545 [Mycobacterium paraense]
MTDHIPVDHLVEYKTTAPNWWRAADWRGLDSLYRNVPLCTECGHPLAPATDQHCALCGQANRVGHWCYPQSMGVACRCRTIDDAVRTVMDAVKETTDIARDPDRLGRLIVATAGRFGVDPAQVLAQVDDGVAEDLHKATGNQVQPIGEFLMTVRGVDLPKLQRRHLRLVANEQAGGNVSENQDIQQAGDPPY